MVVSEDKGDLGLGNIHDLPLMEIMEGDKIKDLHRMNFNEGLGSVSPCNQCDAYLSVPNIWIKNPLYPIIGSQWY